MSPRPPSPHLPHTLSTHFLLIEADRSEEAAFGPGRQGWGMLFRQEKPLCVYLHISAHFSTWLVMFVVEN